MFSAKLFPVVIRFPGFSSGNKESFDCAQRFKQGCIHTWSAARSSTLLNVINVLNDVFSRVNVNEEKSS